MRGLNFLYKAENTCEYDGNNYRVFKQTPTEKTYYNYDGSGNLRFERRGRTEINYIYDAGGIRGMKVTVPTDDPSTYYASSEFYYVKDSLGNIRVILDKSGNIMVEYNYDAWGNFVAEKVREVSIGSVTVDLVSLNAFTYRGYYYDKESGLYYLINRYYAPTTVRFISPDDVGYLDFESFFGTNRYAYCLDDLVNYIDPTGHFSIGTFIKGLGNIITGVLAIGAGAIVLIGGAPIGMIIVAGITLTAGVLTLNNGIADTSESFSGYNYMSDGLFKGNTTAYNWYSGITGTVAGIGTAICGNFIRTEYVMRGAIPGTEGKMTLQPGMELDRFGSQYGRFLTNPGTSASQLNLPFTNNLVLNHYKVLKPFKAATGIVDGGGGFQYFSWRSIKRLISMGYLAVI